MYNIILFFYARVKFSLTQVLQYSYRATNSALARGPGARGGRSRHFRQRAQRPGDTRRLVPMGHRAFLRA
eukprot:6333753-Prymnesium_polylepis.1